MTKNSEFKTQDEIAKIKAEYPKGTRIRLDAMPDDPNPVEVGTVGTVDCVDDAGQLVMVWDNNRSLSLIPGVDVFTIIDIEQAIVGKLIELGWTRCVGEAAIAIKYYKTAVGEKFVHAYLSKSDGYNRALCGNYQSKGINILSTSNVLIPQNSDIETCISMAEKFAANVEVVVAESYAVKLLRYEDNEQLAEKQ